MRTIVLIVLVITSFLSKAQVSQNTVREGYSINGLLSSAANAKIYLLEDAFYKTNRIIDSTVANDSGRFYFNGFLDAPTPYLLRVNFKQGARSFILENSNITITGSANDLPHLEIKGSKENDLNEVLLGLSLSKKIAEAEKALITSSNNRPSIRTKMLLQKKEQLISDQKQIYKRFISNYPTAYASVQLLSYFADQEDLTDAEQLVQQFRVTSVSNPTQLAFFEKLINSRKSVSMGRTAPGFSLPNMEADTVSLSSFKGDYVLLDFWASWCVPCRKENPYLQYLQKKYRNRNFSIVSIAVGDSPVAWQEAIKKDNMTWTNLFEDPSQPISREQYGVMEIPASFLIDPEGNIIGRDLKGEELEKKLMDGLKKRQSASGLKALQN